MSSLPLFTEEVISSRPMRPHQDKAITLLRQSLGKGNRRVVAQLPTGAGKTRLAAEITNNALGMGNRVAFTVPAKSLIDQTVESFFMEGIGSIGVVQANHPLTNPNMPVQVCTVQSLAQRDLPDADIVIVDECHIRSAVVNRWMDDNPRKVFIGLSATPWATGMGNRWQDLVQPVRMQELIDAGYLSPFRVYAPGGTPDLSKVRTKAGDYHENDLSEVMGDAVLMADVVKTWKKHGQGLPTLVFAVDCAHALKLQAEFKAAGVNMGYCDAYVELTERQHLFNQMARGEIAGIVNVATLTTGVDADVRCIVLARPTKSEMLHVQIVGRALRTAEGKSEALILDHAGNHLRLGFVTDIQHDRLLTGNDAKAATRQEKGEAMPKDCGSCGFVKPPKVHQCPSCGFAPEKQSEIEAVDGELAEMKRAAPKPTMDQKAAFYSQVLWIARERNRSQGWAAHTYRDKFGVWPVGEAKAVRPFPPTPEVISFVKAKDIRFAKRRAAR